MTLLSFEDITLGYGSTKVVEHLSFQVNEGDYLCIIGENGSGKSTLMKTCLGLIQPISGNIVLGGGLKPTDIGYLPQQAAIQRDFPASCKEIVLSGCLNQCGLRPFYSKEEKREAVRNIKKMGISHLSKRCYSELSGGQQQRVMLARALCAAKKILLLDEPAAGLDPKVTAEMYALIQQLNKSGMTIMMITHDIAAAIPHATHILHVGGQQIFWGTNAQYQQYPLTSRLCSHYQGVQS